MLSGASVGRKENRSGAQVESGSLARRKVPRALGRNNHRHSVQRKERPRHFIVAPCPEDPAPGPSFTANIVYSLYLKSPCYMDAGDH
jgi:hypothetical protein